MLCQVRLESLMGVTRMDSYAPNTIVQTTCNPLSDQITSLLRLYEILIAVHVRDVPEGLPFDLITCPVLTKAWAIIGVVLHPLFSLR